jgi:hypothetical protein
MRDFMLGRTVITRGYSTQCASISTLQNLEKLTKNSQTPFGRAWGGDHPKSHGKPTITKEEDEQGAERVDAWIRSQFH